MLTHLRTKDTHKLKVHGWKKIFHANVKGKTPMIVILISDKIYFKTKSMVRDKEGHYIMIKETFHQEQIPLVNTYAPNIGASKYVK